MIIDDFYPDETAWSYTTGWFGHLPLVQVRHWPRKYFTPTEMGEAGRGMS